MESLSLLRISFFFFPYYFRPPYLRVHSYSYIIGEEEIYHIESSDSSRTKFQVMGKDMEIELIEFFFIIMEKIQKGVDWLERRKLKFLTVLKIIGRGEGKKKYLACMEKFETIVYYVSFTFFIQRFIYPLRYKILRVYHRAKTAFDLVAI